MIRPEIFDPLGLLTFSFIGVVSFWSLRTGKPIPKWVLYILLIIGIVGFAIDGMIVYFYFLKV